MYVSREWCGDAGTRYWRGVRWMGFGKKYKKMGGGV